VGIFSTRCILGMGKGGNPQRVGESPNREGEVWDVPIIFRGGWPPVLGGVTLGGVGGAHN